MPTDLRILHTMLKAYFTDCPLSGSVAESAEIQELLLRYYKYRKANDANYDN